MRLEISRLEETIRLRIEGAAGVYLALLANTAGIADVAAVLVKAYRTGGKAVLFGNGGSAADAQHIAAELVGKYNLDRRPLPAVALTVNTSSLTAIANDYGFSHVFARQVEALGDEGDVAIGISTSGRSRNILEGLRTAKRIGMVSVLMTGHDGKQAQDGVDYCIAVASTDTPRIQEAHILIGHILCELVEAALCDTMPVQTVFIDRDGVINRKSPHGDDYVKSWAEFEFLPGVKEALCKLTSHGMRLIIVTNQRGVARGMLTEAELGEIHRCMLAELNRDGIHIDGIYYCPHEEGQCACRKPRTELFLRAQGDFPDIDFPRAAVIGDSLADMEAGTRLGCWTILVSEGGRHDAIVAQAKRMGIVVDRVVPSLFEAAVGHLIPRAKPS